MCDLFSANPWKPLLCKNCHQNLSGHENVSKNESKTISTSSMHLYEEIMAQYLTLNATPLVEPSSTLNENEENHENDSFTDEDQEIAPEKTIEFVQNLNCVNTQGIVLIGPDLPTTNKETNKKPKKLQLLRKTKSNAEESLKRNESKSWWFKGKKSQQDSSKPNVRFSFEQKIANFFDLTKYFSFSDF